MRQQTAHKIRYYLYCFKIHVDNQNKGESIRKNASDNRSLVENNRRFQIRKHILSPLYTQENNQIRKYTSYTPHVIYRAHHTRSSFTRSFNPNKRQQLLTHEFANLRLAQEQIEEAGSRCDEHTRGQQQRPRPRRAQHPDDDNCLFIYIDIYHKRIFRNVNKRAKEIKKNTSSSSVFVVFLRQRCSLASCACCRHSPLFFPFLLLTRLRLVCYVYAERKRVLQLPLLDYYSRTKRRYLYYTHEIGVCAIKKENNKSDSTIVRGKVEYSIRVYIYVYRKRAARLL